MTRNLTVRSQRVGYRGHLLLFFFRHGGEGVRLAYLYSGGLLLEMVSVRLGVMSVCLCTCVRVSVYELLVIRSIQVNYSISGPFTGRNLVVSRIDLDLLSTSLHILSSASKQIFLFF